MEVLFPILFLAGILVVAGVAIYIGYKVEQKRAAAMAETCGVMNFQFTPKVSPQRLAEFAGFHLFKQGGSRKGYSLMEGQVGEVPVRLMDYQYTISSGKHSHTHKFTVVHLPAGGVGLPEFTLGPENLFHRIGSLFGFQDIDFEGQPGFNRQYLLRGPDEAAIRAAFTPEAVEYFAANPGLHVQVHQGAFLFHSGKRCDPDKCPELIAQALTVQRLFAQAPAAGDSEVA
jgi:hypothetical protein